jgi:8-oxo-dGTP pyrophosphatase MutT (NUDIX family)
METLSELKIRLTERLNGRLPGYAAQKTMKTRPRLPFFLRHSRRHAVPAAVLILLFPRNGELHFFLTVRTQGVAHHKGQISLPGGAQEADEQLPETALRETVEELGVEDGKIQILGNLSPLFVPVTGYLIHPFVGWLDKEPETRPDPAEVATLFSVAVRELVDDHHRHREWRFYRGIPLHIPYFHFDGYKVWGATAMILAELKALLREVL